MTVYGLDLNAKRSQLALSKAEAAGRDAMRQLSTGLRVQSARDDAAGMAVASAMGARIQSLSQALRNAETGVDLLQTAEGAMGQLSDMQQRMRELSLQALNGTLSNEQRVMIDGEFQQLRQQLAQTTTTTTWNGNHVLAPSLDKAALVEPAQLQGAGPIDTQGPASGNYNLFVNGQTITVAMVAGEAPAARQQKIVAAVNAASAAHGVVASVSDQGGVRLSTPSGEPIAAWLNSSVPGIQAAHWGLGAPAQAQATHLFLGEKNPNLPAVAAQTSHLEYSGYGQSTESVSIERTATASIEEGQLSIVGSLVFRGDGTQAQRIGQIDPVRNGLAGQPLRIQFTPVYENGNFEADLAGSTVAAGWQTFNQRIRLGGADSIAGFATPPDTLAAPRGAGETVYLNTINASTYTTQLVNTGVAARGLAMQLQSSSVTIDAYGVLHGPYVVSEKAVRFNAGDSVSFDWKAQGGADDFDVYAYLLNEDTGQTIELLNQTGSFKDWGTVQKTVNTAGNFKFVFVSGTYDASGGRAAGARLFIDNVAIQSTVPIYVPTEADVAALKSKVQYNNSASFAASVRINGVSFSSGNCNSVGQAATALETAIRQKIAAGQLPNLSLVHEPGSGLLTLRSTVPGLAFVVDQMQVNNSSKDWRQVLAVENKSNTSQIDLIAGATASTPGAKQWFGQSLQQIMPGGVAALRLQTGAEEDNDTVVDLQDLTQGGHAFAALINDLLPSFNPTDHPWLWSTTGAAAPANLLTHAHAQAALKLLDSGMDWLSGARASMGASVNRLTYSQDLIGNARLTASSSRSRIQDLDYGKATAELARAQIMQEAAAAVLAQANLGMQGVLELLA